jgi:hypothetical protein
MMDAHVGSTYIHQSLATRRQASAKRIHLENPESDNSKKCLSGERMCLDAVYSQLYEYTGTAMSGVAYYIQGRNLTSFGGGFKRRFLRNFAQHL